MSRTKREMSPSNRLWLALHPEDRKVRCPLDNGRDGKPRSLMYAECAEGKFGQDRDDYRGLAGRRYHKKLARRLRRRVTKTQMLSDLHGSFFNHGY